MSDAHINAWRCRLQLVFSQWWVRSVRRARWRTTVRYKAQANWSLTTSWTQHTNCNSHLIHCYLSINKIFSVSSHNLSGVSCVIKSRYERRSDLGWMEGASVWHWRQHMTPSFSTQERSETRSDAMLIFKFQSGISWRFPCFPAFSSH